MELSWRCNPKQFFWSGVATIPIPVAGTSLVAYLASSYEFSTPPPASSCEFAHLPRAKVRGAGGACASLRACGVFPRDWIGVAWRSAGIHLELDWRGVAFLWSWIGVAWRFRGPEQFHWRCNSKPIPLEWRCNSKPFPHPCFKRFWARARAIFK